MSMSIRSILKKAILNARLLFGYGMLIFIFIMFVERIKWHLMLPPDYKYDRYMNDVILFALLFNLLAFAFKWPNKGITVALWVIAWSWLIFTYFYILYLSDILYPLTPLPIP
jgi:hypothetical protein